MKPAITPASVQTIVIKAELIVNFHEDDILEILMDHIRSKYEFSNAPTIRMNPQVDHNGTLYGINIDITNLDETPVEKEIPVTS